MRSAEHRFDVLIVGGGPAGMAVAVRAAECGVRVGIVDDNPSFGGQIWRRSLNGESTIDADKWGGLLQRSAGITFLGGYRIFDQYEPGALLAEGADANCELRYEKLVLATGARERFLPFPGWTLPNVMGAGGLQAMVKSGLPIRGKRVIVAGTGPLLLAVAAYLRKHGGEILAICEQASRSDLLKLAASLLFYPHKIAQAMQLTRDLAGVPLFTRSWPLAAHGHRILEGVTISRRGKPQTIPCDYLACGFHLVPNIELQQLLGCQIKNGYVKVDDFQETTVKGIFCAGEPTSIGGVDLAVVEGQIAGLAATGSNRDAQSLFRRREKARRFAHVLDHTFHLRDELKSLAAADTIVCRCEDVPYSRVQEHDSWRAAKLHTRCGMGPCQGRVCGPASQFLFGWTPDSVRPPIFPASVANLAHASPPHSQLSAVTGESA